MTKGLDEILSGAEPAQVETAIAETTTTEAPEPDTQPRGEHGHFAPKETKTEPTPEAAPTAEKPTSQPPPPGVLEERGKRKAEKDRADALELQLAEVNRKLDEALRPKPAPQPKQEPPQPVDLWTDPDRFVQQALTPIQQELQQTRFEISMQNAVSKHGEDVVAKAETAMQQAIERGELSEQTVSAELGRSRSPVMDVVAWYQNQPAVREQKLREEIKAELIAEFGQQPGTAQPQPDLTVMPSNLVGQRNVGTRSGPAWSGPAPLSDIFDRARRKTG